MTSDNTLRNRSSIPVVFCADVNVLDCLSVAVASLLGNASRPVDISVFHDGLPLAAKQFLAATVSGLQSPQSTIEFRDVDLSCFRDYGSLHGNWMTYARLLLPRTMPELDRVIYLDADVTVHRDVTELWETPLRGCAVGGVSHCLKTSSIEQDVWRTLSIETATPYYNAGVLVMDLAEWRRQEADDRMKQYFSVVRGLKTVVDQTALNAVFNGKWADVPGHWNTGCWPNESLPEGDRYALLHYVGSPKPWDPMGRLLHLDAERFFTTAACWGVDLKAARALMPFGPRIRRTRRLARSYLKLLLSRMRKQ